MDALAKKNDAYKVVKLIPGIGEKIAATIISEIGEIGAIRDCRKKKTTDDIIPRKLNGLVKIGGLFILSFIRINGILC